MLTCMGSRKESYVAARFPRTSMDRWTEPMSLKWQVCPNFTSCQLERRVCRIGYIKGRQPQQLLSASFQNTPRMSSKLPSPRLSPRWKNSVQHYRMTSVSTASWRLKVSLSWKMLRNLSLAEDSFCRTSLTLWSPRRTNQWRNLTKRRKKSPRRMRKR